MTADSSSSVPQSISASPWLRDDHWKAGDTAWWIFVTAAGTSRTAVEIVSPMEGTVRDPEVTYNDGVFRASGKFEQIRHRGDSCAPCSAAVLAAGQDGPAT